MSVVKFIGGRGNRWARCGGAASLVFLVFASTCAGTRAEEWLYSTEIPCATAPVYGLPFNKCSISQKRYFRPGITQSWKHAFSDARSAFEVGLYRIVEPQGDGGMGVIREGPRTIAWLQSADALKDVIAGSSGWMPSPSLGDNHLATFERPQQKCVAFLRGYQLWILAGAFCREAQSPISPTEAAFLIESIKVRD